MGAQHLVVWQPIEHLEQHVAYFLLRPLGELRPPVEEQLVEGRVEVLEEVAVLRRVHNLDRIAHLSHQLLPLLHWDIRHQLGRVVRKVASNHGHGAGRKFSIGLESAGHALRRRETCGLRRQQQLSASEGVATASQALGSLARRHFYTPVTALPHGRPVRSLTQVARGCTRNRPRVASLRDRIEQ